MGMKKGSVNMIPSSGAKKVTDPRLVIARANKGTEELIEKFAASRPQQGDSDPAALRTAAVNMQAAVEALRDCVLFMPGKRVESGAFDIRPALIVYKKEKDSPDAQRFLGAFTSLEQVKPGLIPEGTPITTLPFAAICEMAVNFMEAGNSLEGVMINPQTVRFGIPANLVRKVLEAEKERRQTGEKKPIQMSTNPPQPKVENPQADALIASLGECSDPEEKNNIINQLYDYIWEKPVVVPSHMTADKKAGPAVFENRRKAGDAEAANISTCAYTSIECMKTLAPKGSFAAIMKFSDATAQTLKFSSIQTEGVRPIEGLSLCAKDGKQIFFPVKMLERFVQVAERRKAAKENPSAETPKTVAEQVLPKKPQMQLTPEMKAGLEHIRFELTYLPKRFAEQGQALIDDIYARRETCLDELFEDSYTNKREYPYLEEEFSVLASSAREDLEIIRVDFPEADQVVNCAARAYLVWNPKTQKGQYFAAVRMAGKGAKEHIMRCKGDGMVTDMGETVTEGTELSYIIELADRFESGEED